MQRTPTSSAARTSAGTSSAMLAVGARVAVTVNVTAVSGTAPSLTLSLEWSADGTNFGPADPVDAFSPLTAVGVVSKAFDVKARFFRVAWAVAGTTPSFTFRVDTLDSR